MKTILLVDDDCLVLRFCRWVLEHLDDVILLEASCPTEAIECASSYNDAIDLLLSDVGMPGVTGTQLATMLLRSRPSMKVLLMSGYLPDESMLCPEWWFIPKPFPPAQLVATVEHILGRHCQPVDNYSRKAGSVRANK